MALAEVTILAQYGTTTSRPIKVAVVGTTVFGSSGVGDATARTVFTTNVEAPNVLKIKNRFAASPIQSVVSDTELLMADSNIANSDTESTGTISLTLNSTVMTGSGTEFENLSPGDLVEVGAFDPVEIGAVQTPTLITLATNWPNANQAGVAFTGYKVEDFQVHRNETPSLGLHLAHDGDLDFNFLEIRNWLKIEEAILTKSGLFIPIQANESIAVDDCLYVISRNGNNYVVAVAKSAAENLCVGFALGALSLNGTGFMKVGYALTAVGTTNYTPGKQLYVGQNGKITFSGDGQFPASGHFLQSIGVGGGIGALFFSPNRSLTLLP